MSIETLTTCERTLLAHAIKAYIGTSKRDKRLKESMRLLLERLHREDTPEGTAASTIASGSQQNRRDDT